MHAPQYTLFPTLPLELREQIYNYATHPRSHHITVSAADFIYGCTSRLPYFLPKLCHVSEATRIDVGLWFLRTTEFTLLYPQHLVHFAAFLDTFPGTSGWEALRRLELPLFGRHPIESRGMGGKNTYLKFLTRCTRLTELTIKFEIWWLLKNGVNPIYNNSTKGEEVLDRDAVVERYGLKNIFNLRSLTAAVIEVWPKIIRHTKQGIGLEVPDCWSTMESLAQWVREGFGEKGRRVDVRVEESGNSGLRWAGGRKATK